MSAWIAVDFDGTLAEYHDFGDGSQLGNPIMPMVERVKKWLAEGKKVKIFTARVGNSGLRSDAGVDDEDFTNHQRHIIQKWCAQHIGQVLEVTATKDFAMMELWDDRAIQVVANKGIPVGYSTRGN